MKKFFATSLVMIFLFPAMALAAEPPAADATGGQKVKVYLSEPIGAGTEVYHVRKCTKIQKTTALRCDSITSNDGKYRSQCISKDPKTGQEVQNPEKTGPAIQTGKLIQTCVTPQGTDPADSKCTEKKYVDGYVHAVVSCKDSSSCESYGILEYVVSPEPTLDQNSVSPNDPDGRNFATIYSGKNPKIKKVYEIDSCEEGAFDTKNKQLIAGSGTMTGGFPNELGDECTSINQSLIGDGEDKKPAISCNIEELIESGSGTGLLAEFIGAIYRWAASIVGIIAVLVIVVSGIQISMSQGESGQEEAKNRIMQSLTGLVILFLSGLILYTINPNFFTR